MNFSFGDKVTHKDFGYGIWISKMLGHDYKGMCDIVLIDGRRTIAKDVDLTKGWTKYPLTQVKKSPKQRGARSQKQGVKQALTVPIQVGKVGVHNSLDNLLFNLCSGLQPKDLTKGEVQLLIDEYGIHWKDRLGYVGI
jgi:hypothetical protein